MPDGAAGGDVQSAIETAQLVKLILASKAEHAVVLVNSCFGGSLIDEIRSHWKDLPGPRRDLQSLAVITIGDFDERPQHTDRVGAVAWFPGPDGQPRLATGSWDGTVRIWDPDTGDEIVALHTGAPVRSLAVDVTAGHSAIAFGGPYGRLAVLDLPGGDARPTADPDAATHESGAP